MAKNRLNPTESMGSYKLGQLLDDAIMEIEAARHDTGHANKPGISGEESRRLVSIMRDCTANVLLTLKEARGIVARKSRMDG